MFFARRDQAEAAERCRFEERVLLLSRNRKSGPVCFLCALRITLKKLESASSKGHFAQQFGMISSGNIVRLRKKTIGVRKLKKVARGAGLRQSLPYRYVAGSKKFRKSRPQKIERLLIQALTQQHFRFQGSEFPMPFVV